MTRTDRLFRLMDALRRIPGPVTAAALAQDMSVSLRTLYRDIDALRAQGAVIDGAAGYGYTLIEDPSLPPQNLSPDEIEALVLGLREVAALGDPALAAAARSAQAKIGARLPPEQARQLRHGVLHARRFSPPAAPTIDAGALRRACRDEMQIAFSYRDAQDRPTRRDVWPLSIVLMDRAHCLMAHCLLRADFRAFRLDRMTDLQIGQHSFRPRRVPLLRAYMDVIAQEAGKRAPVT